MDGLSILPIYRIPDTAKYYKIAATKDSSRVLRNYQEAIEVVNQSIIKQFELEVYGQTIQFSAPFDEKYAALVGSFGTRGT